MSTLPKTFKLSSAQALKADFDSGINTSTVWAEHIESDSAGTRRFVSESDLRGSLSDDEPDEEYDGSQLTRPARALYQFEGKPEFRELIVDAGEALEVLKEDVGEGWSLVKTRLGEVGLLPQSYYTFTSNFTTAPDLDLSHHPRDASGGSLTPRGSPKHPHTALPLFPQNTGEWHRVFPSFRHSLLGGKSLNRFSSFVTSGAEEWVLKGTPAQTLTVSEHSQSVSHGKEASTDTIADEELNRLSRLGLGEADRHFVDVGPAWKEKIPPFRVMVHSPSKRMSVLSGAYTIYNITSLFQSPIDEEESVAQTNVLPTPMARITVQRRFSHFVILHTALARRLPGIALPPLPDKQYTGRFSEDFVEARRGDLERYLEKIVRHPVARYAEIVTLFLGCESDTEWKRQLPQHLAMPPAGPAFYARVYHPAYNVDTDDAQDAVDAFESHVRAVGKGVQGLRSVFGRIREARVEMSKAERLLSYSLLSLITSNPLSSASSNGILEDEDHAIKTHGLMNDEGAWCWRDGCKDCLKLTKAMQKTSEALQSIADLYDDHARRTLLATHESLKNVAHPASLFEGIVSTHRATLSRFRTSTTDGLTNEDMASRCETVLNTTMAEMDTYHTQKGEDFRTLAQEHLDGEIAFYEQLLQRLRAARRQFDDPAFDQLGTGPRQPSMYERELENPRLEVKALPQPCPHVFDSTPMRPVSVAIQGGVGMLLGPAVGRGSVFGKFW